MSDERWKALHGDCLDVLKALPNESVDAVVTDPPYGLSNHDAADVAEALRAWLDGKPYTPKGGGFMGKNWDAFVPGPEVWKECLRVLKPGGHLLVFSGSRTQDLMGMSVRLAGFDSRDAIRVEGILSYLYGSGFPKSKNVALSIDKGEGHPNRGRAIPTASTHLPGGKYEEEKLTSHAVPPYEAKTDAAKRWEGWGTALKPSYEPVLMFRKPLIGTVAENVLAHGTGAINIDGCRIGTESTIRNVNSGTGDPASWRTGNKAGVHGSEAGRWPPNTVLTHTPDCSPDACVVGCPVPLLDAQSGELPSGSWMRTSGARMFDNNGQPTEAARWQEPLDEGGGASRFFPQFSYTPDDAPFFYTTKAGRAERDEGLSGAESKQVDESRDPDAPGANNPRNRGGRSAANFHPTVKPIALMRWLAKLVTPPGGTVLDPFMGSGTTGCAAMYEGFNFIGIEQSEEYLEIARQRIEYHALRAQGGVVNPWEAPAPEKAPVTKTPDAENEVGSLEDLFGFGE